MPQEAVQERLRFNSMSTLNVSTSSSLAVYDRLTYSNLRYIYITSAKASQIVFSTVLQKMPKLTNALEAKIKKVQFVN